MTKSAESDLLIQFSKTATALEKRFDSWLFIHGISFSEFLVMHELNQVDSMVLPRVQLAEIMGVSPSGVTRMLAPMEKNGIVEKESNPRDARMSLVRLSKTGQRLYKEALASFKSGSESATSSFSESQLTKMAQSLKLLT